MIDHLGIIVNDIKKSCVWYEAALQSIAYGKLIELSKEITGHTDVAGFGVVNSYKADFWLSQATESRKANQNIHIAFRAENRQQVDEFYEAALKAGGKDNGKPGLRPLYHENYYGAFVYDLDGNNLEVVCHNPS
jgi:predicted lactoylglutathione lyase